jgi:hypothetical protein
MKPSPSSRRDLRNASCRHPRKLDSGRCATCFAIPDCKHLLTVDGFGRFRCVRSGCGYREFDPDNHRHGGKPDPKEVAATIAEWNARTPEQWEAEADKAWQASPEGRRFTRNAEAFVAAQKAEAEERTQKQAAMDREEAERVLRLAEERKRADQQEGLWRGKVITPEDLALRCEAARLKAAGKTWSEVAYELAERMTGKKIKKERPLRRLEARIKKNVKRAMDAGLLTIAPTK